MNNKTPPDLNALVGRRFRYYDGTDYRLLAVGRFAEDEREFAAFRALCGSRETRLYLRDEMEKPILVGGIETPLFRILPTRFSEFIFWSWKTLRHWYAWLPHVAAGLIVCFVEVIAMVIYGEFFRVPFLEFTVSKTLP